MEGEFVISDEQEKVYVSQGKRAQFPKKKNGVGASIKRIFKKIAQELIALDGDDVFEKEEENSRYVRLQNVDVNDQFVD